MSAAAAVITVIGVFKGSAGETAPFERLEKDGKFEIRDYPKLVLVSASSESGDKRAADERFMKLFRYIGGSNDKSEKISMTTPVFMFDKGAKKTMSFVMPASVAVAGAPKPNSEEVRVESNPSRRYAVFRFTGLRSEKKEAASLRSLADWMKRRGLKSTGETIYAYYNPPWIPGFLRRNEVLVPIN